MITTDRGSRLVYMLLMCACFSLDPKQLVWVKAADIHVSLTKIRVGDTLEGDDPSLQCTASNLQPGNVLEWARDIMGITIVLARNGMLLDMTDSRYELLVSPDTSDSTVRNEILIIRNATKDDDAFYYCRVKDMAGSSATIVNEDSFRLIVLYFPADMYPICSPNGSFTVQEGTTQLLSCTTEIGNPTVQIQIETNGVVNVWTYLRIDDVKSRSLNLSVNTTANDTSYECKITSSRFPGMQQSCTIGPIMVSPMTSTIPDGGVTRATDIDASSPTASQQAINSNSGEQVTTAFINDDAQTSDTSATIDLSFCYLCRQASPVPWISAFIVILILFAVSFIINIFTIFKLRRPKTPEIKDNVQPEPEPYMELQPTDDKSRAYEEPQTTTVQQTYYQPPEENEELLQSMTTHSRNTTPSTKSLAFHTVHKTAEALFLNRCKFSGEIPML